ncbi:MAG: SBBP repeat-containing protein, partial [Aureispira sp.]
YPGIDWVIYTTGKGLKYDFVVQAGADPSQIQLRFKDHEGLTLNEDGSFTLSNRMGTITEKAPVSFQGDAPIATAFELEEDIVSFQLADYEEHEGLVIDPLLVWGTYYGGNDADWGRGCAVDAQGNVYLAGETELRSNNLAFNGHQNVYGGGLNDAFLVKFNANGVRQWETYYGGNREDRGLSCTVDNQGNVYLAGSTESTNNIASNGHQNVNGGNYDAFLVKFNGNGVRQWGTYYGGNNDDDYGISCAVDTQGNVYLAGGTRSTNNIASNGHQNVYGGVGDAFLVKFNGNGVRQWATYYGGNHRDWGVCTVDNQGNVYLTGGTGSTNNIASNGHQNVNGGNYDAFLVKFNGNGVRRWGTYYGGNSYDYGTICAVDNQGNIYLAGHTQSTNNIALNGHQNVYIREGDGFLAKFQTTSSTTTYTITGTVRSSTSTMLSGGTVTFTGSGNFPSFTTTTINGTYTVAIPDGWSGRATAS